MVGAVVAADIANASLARCIQLPALIVVMKHRYLSSHEMIGLSIAAIVTSHRVRAAAITTAARAGSSDDRNFSAPWRFF